MMTIHDPTAYEIHFFAIPSPREAKKLHGVLDFLNAAVTEFAQGVQQAPPGRILQLEDYSELSSDRLAAVPATLDATGLSLELDVRTLHDAVFLRSTALREGPIEMEQVKALRFAAPLPQPRQKVQNYLGAFRVLYVETESQEAAQRAEVGPALADAFGWTWFTGAEALATPLGTLWFAVQPRTAPPQAAAPALDLIFVGGRDAAALAERDPFHPFLLTLPELALCHLKVRNSVANIRGHWMQQLAERERELRKLLPLRSDAKPKLLDMLKRNDDITTWQAELVDAEINIQAELRTMRINRDIFASAVAGPFRVVADHLKQLLIDRWMRGTELQAENDIGYIQGTLQLAETHFKSIAASAEVDQARALRHINGWVIVLGVLQVLIGVVAACLAWVALYAPPAAPSTPPTHHEKPPK